MKYKDFKVMSQNEMKNVKGGNAPGGGNNCNAACDSTCTLSTNETGKCASNANGCFCVGAGS